MFTFSMFRRQDDRPAARRPNLGRRPVVESLEGRRVLSTLTVVPSPGIQGQHIGMSAAIVGSHIGTNVAGIQGNHIGSMAAGRVGAHID